VGTIISHAHLLAEVETWLYNVAPHHSMMTKIYDIDLVNKACKALNLQCTIISVKHGKERRKNTKTAPNPQLVEYSYWWRQQ